MSGEIDFDLPLFGATVYHSTPGTDGVWNRAFNCAEGGSVAIKKVMELFEADGLNVARIYSLEIFPLATVREGGENAGSGSEPR